jgi:hypothetical protein
MRARRARATWAGMLLAPALWCCASSPLDPFDGGFRNARHGYWIGTPPASDPAWKRDEVEGSLLAYRRGAIRMTFSSRCPEVLARPEFLARHLRIGIPANVVREAGPVELAGLEGWQQVFDADTGGGAVRVKTVTIVANGCALDWVLIGREPAGFEEAEHEFDAWWQTLAVVPQGPPTATASDGGPREEKP